MRAHTLNHHCSMPSSSLFYVRHGETVWNRMGRLQGQQDSPLTRRGVELAIRYGEVLAARLDGSTRVVVHSSPLGRARQTAALLADVLGLDANAVRVDELLVELHMGEWSGHTWPQLAERLGVDPHSLKGWTVRPPGGESRLEMLDRAKAWIDRHRERERATPEGAVTHIVVAHGGLSRVFRGAWLGLEVDRMRELPMHAHGQILQLHEGRIEQITVDDGDQPAEDLLG